MIRNGSDNRCAAVTESGGRGYGTSRCRKRATPDDPDQLCRYHRVERDGYGHPAQRVEAEYEWQADAELDARLELLAQHLKDFFRLDAEIEYDATVAARRPTNRLIVGVDDLLRALNAVDLLPRRP
jgi:hypothetical protein